MQQQNEITSCHYINIIKNLYLLYSLMHIMHSSVLCRSSSTVHRVMRMGFQSVPTDITSSACEAEVILYRSFAIPDAIIQCLKWRGERQPRIASTPTAPINCSRVLISLYPHLEIFAS